MLPPSLVWSPARQAQAGSASVEGPALISKSPVGLPQTAVHSLFAKPFAQTILFKQSVSGKNRVCPGLPPLLCPYALRVAATSKAALRVAPEPGPLGGSPPLASPEHLKRPMLPLLPDSGLQISHRSKTQNHGSSMRLGKRSSNPTQLCRNVL